MKIDKKKLALLQGLNPCISSVSFTPPIYDDIEGAEGMEGLIPSFTCKTFNNKQSEEAKGFLLNKDNLSLSTAEKTKQMLPLVEACLVDWKNMIDLSTEEAIEYSKKYIKNLTYAVLESIFLELCYYDGFIRRGRVREPLS